MTSQLSVSTRESLKFGSAPATEQTDTLVLVGRTGYFVDLRVFKDRSKGVDWAMAGRKLVLDEHDGKTHAEFQGVFDSRSNVTPPSDHKDEAYFEPLSKDKTLETGSMLNPDNDWKLEPYEELWLDLKLEEDTPCLMLRSSDNNAFLGRIGRWQLGLNKTGAVYTGIRWELNQSGSWEVVYSSEASEDWPGMEPLPVEGFDVKAGQQVDYAGKTWIVEEKSGKT